MRKQGFSGAIFKLKLSRF